MYIFCNKAKLLSTCQNLYTTIPGNKMINFSFFETNIIKCSLKTYKVLVFDKKKYKNELNRKTKSKITKEKI